MKTEFPQNYEALEAARIYLTRRGIKKYPLDKVSRWVGSTIKDQVGPPLVVYYTGSFIDCLVQFMRDKHYFNGWVSRDMEQVDNCNNGTIEEFLPTDEPEFKNVSLGFKSK